MAARRVKTLRSKRPEASILRAALVANTHATSETDPLRVRRERLDNELRSLRSLPKTLVDAID